MSGADVWMAIYLGALVLLCVAAEAVATRRDRKVSRWITTHLRVLHGPASDPQPTPTRAMSRTPWKPARRAA